MSVRVDVAERVRKVVAEILQVPLRELTSHVPLADLAAIDSLMLAEILAALDDEFRTHVPSEGLTAAASVDDLVRLVEHSPPR